MFRSICSPLHAIPSSAVGVVHSRPQSLQVWERTDEFVGSSYERLEIDKTAVSWQRRRGEEEKWYQTEATDQSYRSEIVRLRPNDRDIRDETYIVVYLEDGSTGEYIFKAIGRGVANKRRI